MEFINWLKKKHHYGRYMIVRGLIKGKKKNLLDVGCGPPSDTMKDGSFLRFVGYGVGIDIKKREIPFPFFKAGIEAIPFKNKSFDVITVIEVIEHVPHPDIALNELARVLKDDGTLILTTPNNHFFFKIFWFLWGNIIGGMWSRSHVSSYNKKGWLRYIKNNGNFKVTYLKNYWYVNLIMHLEKLKKNNQKIIKQLKSKGDF